jgi:hypothetical protein
VRRHGALFFCALSMRDTGNHEKICDRSRSPWLHHDRKTVEEIEENIREAIELHLEGMIEDGNL